MSSSKDRPSSWPAIRGPKWPKTKKSWALLGLVTTLGVRVLLVLPSLIVPRARRPEEEAGGRHEDHAGVRSSRHGRSHGRISPRRDPLAGGNEGGYGTTSGLDHVVKAKISEVVRPFFKKFDQSGDGHLDKGETKAVFHDLGEDAAGGVGRDL